MRVYSNSVFVLNNTELIALARQAVVEVLGQDKDGKTLIGTYEYKCISILDSKALEAMKSVKPHDNSERYLRTAKKALKHYLAEHPDFLQPRVSFSPTRRRVGNTSSSTFSRD